MGGEDGSRGYLVQTIIALLDSLDGFDWEIVTIEPKTDEEKVDISWERSGWKKVSQVKSSKNQIGKADAEKWASELAVNTTADKYELILIGPCSQSVVTMGAFNGVDIPHPKSLDPDGMIEQAAHRLEKFLIASQLSTQTAYQRELMVKALITDFFTSVAKPLTQNSLKQKLAKDLRALTQPVNVVWANVSFDNQRSIEHAVAGQRLGPLDVDACPEHPAVARVQSELETKHVYEIVGTPGCGKSVTGWQVAKKFADNGYAVRRPALAADIDELVRNIPQGKAMLVVDDSQQYGFAFAQRLSEISSSETKVLFMSTIDKPNLTNLTCISPEQGVDSLSRFVQENERLFFELMKANDSRVGNRRFDVSFERRFFDCKRQSTPWAFFWILRGGWQSATRELKSLSQFNNARQVLTIIAVGQELSCDAGVTQDWVKNQANQLDIPSGDVETSLYQLEKLGLIVSWDKFRTKHLSYARIVIEDALHHEQFETWEASIKCITNSILQSNFSLKGAAWLLGAMQSTDAIRWDSKTKFELIQEPLIKRCVDEKHDLDWAAGCFSKIIGRFEYSVEEIMAHRATLLNWIYAGGGELCSNFCGEIINHLINESGGDENKQFRPMVKTFIEEIDESRLLDVANNVSLDQFYNFGYMLDRIAYFRPDWSERFHDGFDWKRAREIILTAPSKKAHSVTKFLTNVSAFGPRKDDGRRDLTYIHEVTSYFTKVLNEDAIHGMYESQDLYWMALGFMPRFLRGGYTPDEEQMRIAKEIFAKVDAQVYATALENAVSRNLETLAHTFSVFHEVEPKLIQAIAAQIDEPVFFEATKQDWEQQTEELNHLIRCFCLDKDLNPSRKWIAENRHQFTGPMEVIFAAIAPDVAMKIHGEGGSVELTCESNPHWHETVMAITGMAKIDEPTTIEIVQKQLHVLLLAFYHIELSSTKWMVNFLRLLHELSPELFDDFVSRIDFDHPTATETIDQLVRTQRRKIDNYRSMARVGIRQGGKIGIVATDLLSRLNRPPKRKGA